MSARVATGWRRFTSALAIASVLVNALILTVHATSSFALSQSPPPASLSRPALIGGVGPDALVICKGDHAALAQERGAPEKPPADKTSCPICLGMAAMQLAVLSEPVELVQRMRHGTALPETYAVFILDHRPLETVNRGPPLLT